ncbi:unnamed protein product [Rotaria magnacalcarata]|uniref:Glycosyltransferase 61 catalytic domain-containing protein n=1 Tax=Rotaria magnacalcarata TaxID=392030 RepID=A0A820DZN0_9BILA|nr:unnamed protein product [Rotaria magnacalcarata]CAF4239231.1 unnamed protein product [Rotaria magnacalcarata]
MRHFKFGRKFSLWLLCSFLVVFTIYSFHFLFEAYSRQSLHIPSLWNETVPCQSDERKSKKASLRFSNSESTWTCAGNMNYESEWYSRTCAFKNICYNKEKKVFQFYRKPGSVRKPVLFEPKLGHIYEFNMNNHGFVSLVARPSHKESWGPTIVEELLPSPDKVPYLEHVHVLFLHWYVTFNLGHVTWEDIASTYFAMVRLNEYDRNAVLLEYQNYPKRGDQFYQMYENLIPAFAAKVDSLDNYMNNFSSPLICFQTIVAGGAQPVFSIDHESYTHGKETLLYDFRTAVLRYHGINVLNLPKRHRIVLVNKTNALRKSLRAIKNLIEVKQFINVTYPEIQLDVIDWSRYSFSQQLHELYKTTILITPCGGISAIIPFLPEGTHAIVMDYYVNKAAYLPGERYQVGESGSMEAALWYHPSRTSSLIVENQ